MKIDVPLSDNLDKCWRVVRGDLVPIAPHVVGTFVVHQNPWRSDWGYGNCRRWVVSNVESGLRVSGEATRDEAIEAARKRLAGFSNAKYLRALRKCKPQLPPDVASSRTRY